MAISCIAGCDSRSLSAKSYSPDRTCRQISNVETLMGEVKLYKVKDSLNVASVSSLNLTVEELKKYRAEDAKLIKELKLRLKDVEYIAKTEIKTKDSLIYKIDTVGCFHYRDKWLRVDACIADSSMVIETRDSIAQIVHAIYKHRFLWWKWGIKGFPAGDCKLQSEV